MAEASDTTRTRFKTVLTLLAFTLLAFAIHGYHYGIEDEAIYLPAIKKILDPSLYPRDSEFFMGQARGTALPWIIAGLTRLTRAPLPWVVITAQFASIYTFLGGCWMVTSQCFPARRQRWAGVALVTALLTLPVAGTSIYLADQHLHPRTLACALVLMAIAWTMEVHRRDAESRSLRRGKIRGRKLACVFACIAAALIHPLMALYGIAFVVVLWLPLERWKDRSFAGRSTILCAALVTLPFLAHPTAAWREALATREYYTLRNWEWYEWLGLLAPIIIVWWLGRIAERQQLPTLARLMRRLNMYAAGMCVITLAVTLPNQTEFLWPLQPARYLHTVYVLMILASAGLLTHKRAWPVALVSVVLALLMCVVQWLQFALFTGTPHIDWPDHHTHNAYVQAFLWARDHTPKKAYFAMDPEYMRYSANYGFRALAERSQMADISKDAGVVTVSPQIAADWKRQVDAIRGWRQFTPNDFARLRRDFGVDWVVLNTDGLASPYNMDCPFVSSTALVRESQLYVVVCRTPSAPLEEP